MKCSCQIYKPTSFKTNVSLLSFNMTAGQFLDAVRGCQLIVTPRNERDIGWGQGLCTKVIIIEESKLYSAAVIAQDDQYYEMSQGVEGNDVPTSADMGGENYEVMSAEQENEAQGGEAAGEDYMAMEDDPGQEDYVEPQAKNTADENYEVTEQSVKPPAPVEQEENYEIPGADEDYEGIEDSKYLVIVIVIELIKLILTSEEMQL